MKRILELLRPHWGTIALGAVFSMLVSIINGGFAFFVQTIVDDIFVMGDKLILFSVAIGIIVAFIFRGTFVFIQNYLMFKVGSRVVRDIRNSLYERIVRLPMQYFGNDSRGSLMSKIISDAGILQELIAFRIKDLFVSLGTIVILAGVALYRRWDLTILALGVLPFAFYLVSILGKRLKKVSHRAQRKLAQITESLVEGLTGIKIIKSFGVEEQETEKFTRKTNEYYLQFMKSTKILQLTVMLMEVVVGIGIAVIIYYGGLLVSDGTITSGEFFSFMTAILMIFTPAKRLAAVNNGLQQAQAYVERIDEVLFSPIEEEGELEEATFNSEIAYENITFKYPGREDFALDGVNVKIKKGELVALVGRSGSGKSTFVDMLERFFDPQEGYVRIDGVDFRQFKRRALRSLSGVVSQNVILFNDSVKANIAFGRPGATDEDIQAAAKTAFAHDFIMELPDGYDTMIGEGGSSLSGGQRQRISIARAVVKDPEILILDEATSSLDTQSEIMVQKAMDNLIESGGQKTLIVIAHRLSTIKRADRIIVLDKGKVIESGSHSELLKLQGMYSHLYSLQHGDHKHEGIDVSSL